MTAPLQIGLVLFPKVTQLDFTGPLQVFSSLPGAEVHLIWKRIEPVPSDSVMTLTPTAASVRLGRQPHAIAAMHDSIHPGAALTALAAGAAGADGSQGAAGLTRHGTR
jgi:hypothetical protein